MAKLTKPESSRLFFALWPDAPIQDAFALASKQLQKHCGGYRTRRENIHLTLAFLGETEHTRIPAIVDFAQTLRLQQFNLSFTRLGWWQSNQVAWAAPDTTPRALSELVKQLRLGLMELGFKFDERRYFPHVSLLRKARCTADSIATAPILWPLHSFALVRSTQRSDGSHYAILQRWPLQHSDD